MLSNNLMTGSKNAMFGFLLFTTLSRMNFSGKALKRAVITCANAIIRATNTRNRYPFRLRNRKRIMAPSSLPDPGDRLLFRQAWLTVPLDADCSVGWHGV